MVRSGRSSRCWLDLRARGVRTAFVLAIRASADPELQATRSASTSIAAGYGWRMQAGRPPVATAQIWFSIQSGSVIDALSDNAPASAARRKDARSPESRPPPPHCRYGPASTNRSGSSLIAFASHGRATARTWSRAGCDESRRPIGCVRIAPGECENYTHTSSATTRAQRRRGRRQQSRCRSRGLGSRTDAAAVRVHDRRRFRIPIGEQQPRTARGPLLRLLQVAGLLGRYDNCGSATRF